MSIEDEKKKEQTKKVVDEQAGQTRLDYHAHLMATQAEVARATDRAIALGQEFTLLLANEKPLTACLVAYCLAKNQMQQYPKIWQYIKKLPI